MQIIPVIDLKDGVVVHAKEGKRNSYQPISTELCRSSDIFDMLRAYLSLYEFPTFYIADLNAISGVGSHDRLVDKVAAHFPDKEFWFDNGGLQNTGFDIQPVNLRPVLGSESIQEETTQSIKSFRNGFILSLDYLDSNFLGTKNLLANQALWPNDIIIMTLDRVGSNSGPDIAKLQTFCLNYPDKNFIAAGGIRNREDVMILEEIGIKQVLVASALHSGAINRRDLAELQT